MTTLQWGSATDQGLVRQVNEDAFVARPPLFVVADGMGGHAAGDVAAGVVVRSFSALAGHPLPDADSVVGAVTRANDSILRTARDDSSRAGMGSTVAGLALVAAGDSEHWLAFNVGDSRVYRFHRGSLNQVTVDHSEVQELVDAGQLTQAEAATHPRRHVITRCLGTQPAPTPDSWMFPPEPGERFIICSDGLTNELSDAEIESIAGSVRDPERVARELVAGALAAGGRDNVTVVVVDGMPANLQDDDDDTARRAGRQT